MTMLLNAQTQYELEQFYYAEAACLDEARYTDWLALFADDARYWVPVRQTRLTGQLDEEFTKPGEIALFDDDMDTLGIRVRKLQSAYAWGENPPSRTRHMYSNIRVTARDEDSLTVSMNFTFYRGYLAQDADWWAGRREDVLRPHEDSFKIARRHVFLDQTVILSKNMSHFF
ncbi:MAG: 3-phenylpropionate/cinnamic acid dioxygenase subunit beta [Hyphomicrobiales bacterium]|nr:MAG: 3-phenylpropionate/cinnamic acid dioxygenase subunit beta [Hyphomicrobiales bacterium]